VLKNAIDWASRRMADGSPTPLTGKPLAIMGAGGRFGTLRAQMHLRDIVLYFNMHPLNTPQLVLPQIWNSFDQSGNLIDDALRTQLRDLLQALATWAQRLRAGDEA
jgi:chromate reductase